MDQQPEYDGQDDGGLMYDPHGGQDENDRYEGFQ